MAELLSLTELLQRDRCALIVWDMQTGIGARAHNLESMRPQLAGLIRSARTNQVPIIWSRHVGLPVVETPAPTLRLLARRQAAVTMAEIKPFMARGTTDVEFIEGLGPGPGDLVLEKLTPSFFIGTPLELILRTKRIQTLVLTGVATEMGIEFTARHAHALGFDPVVVEDAVGSYTAEGHNLGISYLRAAVDVVAARTIVTAWTANA